MTTILARKKNGKKCQSVTGFKNVEGVLSKHLNVGSSQKDRCGTKTKEKQLPFFHYLVFKEKIRQKD